MKAFKIMLGVVIFWILVGIGCMLFKVPDKPYADYWYYIGLGLSFVLNISLLRMIIFNKK